MEIENGLGSASGSGALWQSFAAARLFAPSSLIPLGRSRSISPWRPAPFRAGCRVWRLRFSPALAPRVDDFRNGDCLESGDFRDPVLPCAASPSAGRLRHGVFRIGNDHHVGQAGGERLALASGFRSFQPCKGIAAPGCGISQVARHRLAAVFFHFEFGDHLSRLVFPGSSAVASASIWAAARRFAAVSPSSPGQGSPIAARAPPSCPRRAGSCRAGRRRALPPEPRNFPRTEHGRHRPQSREPQ